MLHEQTVANEDFISYFIVFQPIHYISCFKLCRLSTGLKSQAFYHMYCSFDIAVQGSVKILDCFFVLLKV